MAYVNVIENLFICCDDFVEIGESLAITMNSGLWSDVFFDCVTGGGVCFSVYTYIYIVHYSLLNW